ncbi:MAG: peptidoglycan-binding protein [Hyphomicrobiaceae bacterium]
MTKTARRLSMLAGALVFLLSHVAAFAQAPPASGPGSAMQPGEAFVTRFSGIRPGPSPTLDPDGIVGSITDIRKPGQPAQGQHWLNEPQRAFVKAREVGQVFGVALDNANPPNIYITATAAFGLHRTADNRAWMPGMWGAGGGPGTIYKLSAANGYKPAVFSNVTLDGRENTGAALGNIAYDQWHDQLLVTDLETGMIHRIAIADGKDLGRFDHGVEGRGTYFDTEKASPSTLPSVAFDPASRARIADCPTGDFSATPECWNIADFRRRIWGIGVRRDDATGEVRVYYAVWGSAALGSAGFATAPEDEKHNSLWSVAMTEDGHFDPARVTREMSMPEFFIDPVDVARFGASNPVSDITFPRCGPAKAMLMSERGGMRNLGLAATHPFADPFAARVLRYNAETDDSWTLAGRYDVGYFDRRGMTSPRIRANGAGGADFGYGYDRAGQVDLNAPDQSVWITGDWLCSPAGPCFNPAANKRSDGSHVSGLQGGPEAVLADVLPEMTLVTLGGDAYPPAGPRQSYMIDTDQNLDGAGQPIVPELTRDDATKIGDVAVYQSCSGAPVLAPPQPPPLAPPTVTVVTEGTSSTPPPPQPDLEKRKTGPATCIAGDVCSFTITVANVGTGTWNGPLFETDTMPPGATLANFAPQPEWACTQAGDSVNCAHDTVTLAPGQFVTLTMDIVLPPGMVGTVENCVEDVWAPLGPDDSADVILAIERRLSALGYDPGPVDGVLDAQTTAAITAYQTDFGLDVDGAITDTLRDALFPEDAGLSGDANPLNDRACHSVDVLPPPLPPPPLPPVVIPVAPPLPPTDGTRTAQCNDTVQQGGDAPEAVEIDLGNRDGKAAIEWNMVSVKDQMRVFVDGVLVHDTQCVSGTGTQPFSVPPGARKVRVEVNPNCEGTKSTVWDFKVLCPPPKQPITLVGPAPPPIFTPIDTLIPLPPRCPPGTWRHDGRCQSIIDVIKIPPRCPPPLVRRHGTCVCPNGTLPHHGRCFSEPEGCRPPLVLRHGRCVCPEGTRLQHGRCAPVTVCRPPLVNRGGTCVCPNGRAPHHGRCEPIVVCRPPLVARGGRCVCPNGAIPVRGRCISAPTCRPPMIARGGHCVCPAGTTARNGSCVPVQACRPPMVLRHGRCVMPGGHCPPGQRFVNGRCIPATHICPPGQQLRNGRCIVSPGHCPPGQIMRNGRCVQIVAPPCPPGTHRLGNRCIPIPGPIVHPCPPGQRRIGNRCVPGIVPPPVICPPGQHRVGNRCVGPIVHPCPPGQRRIGNRCVPGIVPPPVICPPGQRRVGNRCVGPIVHPCPPGQRRIGNRCVPGIVPPPVICPPGQHRVGNRCVGPIVHPCPPGQRRIGNRCVPGIVPPPVICPPGQHRVGNRCVGPIVHPCPPGQRRIGNRCVPGIVPPPVICPPGQRRVGNRCVGPIAHPCPPGQRRIGNRCVPVIVPPVVCRPGTVRQGNHCVPIVRPPPPRPPIVRPPPPRPPVVRPPPRPPIVRPPPPRPPVVRPPPRPPIVRPPPRPPVVRPPPRPPIVRPRPPRPPPRPPIVRPRPPRPPVVRPPPRVSCPGGTVRQGNRCVPIRRR